jgi:3-hydroxybutyrate dehydrogenase
VISFDVSGKRTLVIGASSGIGYAIARAFADAGSHVMVVAEIDGIHDAAQQLEAETARTVRAIQCDITDRAAVRSMATAAGPVDVLINNAGIVRETPVADLTTSDTFGLTMDVNVSGLFRVTQAVLPNMAAGGRIIFTSSLWGRTAGPRFGAYVASKHAVLGLVKSLAMELGPRGITVNAVCPGSTATEMNLRELPEEALDALKSQMWIRPDPIPPEHIAAAYVFLASPAASEITGQGIHVDRGQYMGA